MTPWLEAGAYYICLVRDWIPQSQLLHSTIRDRITVVRGDILGEYEIDTVFHLAAQTIVTIANRNPISTFESNIKGTWSLLEASRRSPAVKQSVLASSDKAFFAFQRSIYDILISADATGHNHYIALSA